VSWLLIAKALLTTSFLSSLLECPLQTIQESDVFEDHSFYYVPHETSWRAPAAMCTIAWPYRYFCRNCPDLATTVTREHCALPIPERLACHTFGQHACACDTFWLGGEISLGCGAASECKSTPPSNCATNEATIFAALPACTFLSCEQAVGVRRVCAQVSSHPCRKSCGDCKAISPPTDVF
jgi:hypothetical protein